MATWLVDSYGYPNPFTTSRAKAAWYVLTSFSADHSYASVKGFWETHPTDPKSSNTVESWKSAFEQFGLLYVLAGTDDVVITPGGLQLFAAAQTGDQREFAWVGLNLLLRYPLSGKTGRPQRSADHQTSDVLPYWLLHSALLELDGLSQQEMFRVVGQVFQRQDAPAAIDRVRAARANPSIIAAIPDPTGGGAGGVYNSLNQVLVAGGLNHMVLTSSKQPSLYVPETNENDWQYVGGFRDIVELAVGASSTLPPGCAVQARLSERMPTAPVFPDEQTYFDYAGAAVTPLAEALLTAQQAVVPEVDYDAGRVLLLTAGIHFAREDADHVVGPVQSLCVLAVGGRVLVNDDLTVTHIVEQKVLLAGDRIRVRLRRARPVLDAAFVQGLFEEGGVGV